MIPACHVVSRRNAQDNAQKSIVDARGNKEAHESRRGTHTRGTVSDARRRVNVVSSAFVQITYKISNSQNGACAHAAVRRIRSRRFVGIHAREFLPVNQIAKVINTRIRRMLLTIPVPVPRHD